MYENLIRSTQNFAWSKNETQRRRILPLEEASNEEKERFVASNRHGYWQGYREGIAIEAGATFKFNPQSHTSSFTRLPILGGFRKRDRLYEPSLKQIKKSMDRAKIWLLGTDDELFWASAQKEQRPLFEIFHLWLPQNLNEAQSDLLAAWVCGVLMTHASDGFELYSEDRKVVEQFADADASDLVTAWSPEGKNLWHVMQTRDALLSLPSVAGWVPQLSYLEKRLANLSSIS